jgi:hypothetical protein
MTSERALPGTRVRVTEQHRVEERRGLVGTVVARYGGEEYVAVDVRLADGHCRLFWPRDLEVISSPRAWGRSLLGEGNSGQLRWARITRGWLLRAKPSSTWQ